MSLFVPTGLFFFKTYHHPSGGVLIGALLPQRHLVLPVAVPLVV